MDERVKCIKNDEKALPLTIGKVYNIVSEENVCFWIINDIGQKQWYLKERFEVEQVNNKYIFDMNNFQIGDIAINCENDKEANILFDILKEYDLPKVKQNYSEKTCYRFYDNGICQGDIQFYKDQSYKVLKFSNMDFSQHLNKLTIPKQNNKLNIKELAKTMTRFEFLEQIDKDEGVFDECVKYTDIDITEEMFEGFNCCPDANCKKCFEIAIKDIFFIGDRVTYKDDRVFSNGKKVAIISRIQACTWGDYDLIWLDDVELGWVSREDIKLYKDDNIVKEQSKPKFIFNIEDFKKNDITIKCKSQKQADKLFEILIINGVQNWIDGNNLKDNTMFHMTNGFDKGRIYYNYELEDKGLDWGMSKSWYKNNGYNIIKFKNIDFGNVWDKESIDEASLMPYRSVNSRIQTKMYVVEFTYNAINSHYFISEDDNIKIGEIVMCECQIGSKNYQYCKVKDIVETGLYKEEFKSYRNCKKLS